MSEFYDWAASMNGKFKGVQIIISSLSPQVLYVHCASHALNLATRNATSIESIRDFTGVMEKIYSVLNTPKRNEVLQRMISVHAAESSKAKLVKPYPPQWVERHESVMVVVEPLNAVYYTLQEISTWQDTDSSSPAMILMSSMLETPFIILLCTQQKCFSYTLLLSKALQTADCDLVSALNHILDIVAQFKYMQNESQYTYHDIHELASRKAASCGTELKRPRSVSRQTHWDNVPGQSAEEYSCRSIFIPFNDHIISQLNDRFIEHQDVTDSFSSLLPSG
jgi:hypothetical protein